MGTRQIRENRSFAPMIVVLAVLVAAAGLTLRCGAEETGVQLVEYASYEGGRAYKTGDGAYWVLNLNGAWRAMGRQYGGLVGDELRRFLAEITDDIARRGMPVSSQQEFADSWTGTLCENLKELLGGLAETSGLNQDEVSRLDAGIVMLSTVALGGAPPSACSAIAAWDGYTPNGALVFGRNWDIDRQALLPYMKYLSVVVFNPDSGNAFANVHPLGDVYLETGMNELGLFIELNNGAYSDPGYMEERENTTSLLATALNESSTLEEASSYLVQTPADLAYIIQIADAEECVSAERATFSARVRRGDQEGVLAAYNSFVPPYPEDWAGKVTDPRPEDLDPRYRNLIRLANSDRFRGKLDVESMKELLDIGVYDGGAVHPGTVYQVIALPEQLTLWVRALDFAGWQQVNLRDLFGRR